jgi:phage portal protein BeeE
MSFIDRIRDRAAPQSAVRRAKALKTFTMPPFWSDGARVALSTAATMPNTETGGEGFQNAVTQMYKANGPFFSCTMVRARVFNQARFLYQRMRQGRPLDLFWQPDLKILERPNRIGSAASYLTDAEVDASVSGNNYMTLVDADGNIGRAARRDNDPKLVRMRPDWVKLIIRARSGNPFNVDAQVVGLEYAPPGMQGDPLILVADEFSHYAPIPDPEARFRGMSWLTPIYREAMTDKAYTNHKESFLRNGATPNLVIKMSDDVEDDDFQAFVQKFKDDYEGSANAYKTLFVAGGADVVPLSVDFQQLDLRATQAQVETRICMGAGVHPVIAGVSEGLQGSSLNQGNFGAAKRLFVDTTIRDLWGQMSGCVEVFAPSPDDARMWYDARDIPFLRDDAQQESATFFTQTQAARQLADGGWDPDAAVAAAKVSDIGLMVGKHTGLLSVQLQEPGTAGQQDPAATGTDGNAANGRVPTLDLGRGTNGNGRQAASTSG